MNKTITIAIIGLGQVGNYLYRELNLKKKDIETKTGKNIQIVAISAKNKNKKRKYKINKNIFYVTRKKFDGDKFIKFYNKLEAAYKEGKETEILSILKKICKI